MDFSFRDARSLKSQSGQGTIEYVLILVVAVAIILGLMYQLNTAFRSWANSYFGDYLACLLETGELPTIGGSPGDSGICDQLFKTFSLAEGRPLKDFSQPGPRSEAGGGPSGGTREQAGGGSNYRPAGSSGGRFSSGSGGGVRAGVQRRRINTAEIGTGNMSAVSYVNGYSYYQPPLARRSKIKLDNRFALEQEREITQRRRSVASSKKEAETRRPSIKLKKTAFRRTQSAPADSGFTVGNFIKILLIIAIIIALVVFIGSQVLSISKSME